MHVEIYKQSFSPPETLPVMPCQHISKVQISAAGLALAPLFQPSCWHLCGGNRNQGSNNSLCCRSGKLITAPSQKGSLGYSRIRSSSTSAGGAKGTDFAMVQVQPAQVGLIWRAAASWLLRIGLYTCIIIGLMCRAPT